MVYRWQRSCVRVVDANYVMNVDTRMSIFEYIFTLFEIAVYWKINLQSMVVLSTTQLSISFS